MSDGGEDQGADEVTVHGAEEGGIITSVLERAVSRERLFLFSAVVRDTRAVSSQPRVQRAFGHTRG